MVETGLSTVVCILTSLAAISSCCDAVIRWCLSPFCRFRLGLSPSLLLFKCLTTFSTPEAFFNADARSRYLLPSRRSGAASDRRPDCYHHAQSAERVQFHRSLDRQEAGTARRGGRGERSHPRARHRGRRPRLLRRRRSAHDRGRGG